MIKCEALKIKSDWYLCLIKAKEIISECVTDAYDANMNTDGYQRKIQKSRAKKFSIYLNECEGSFNGTVLLNVRSHNGLKFAPSKDQKTGTLEISQDVFVVDGQHRIEGLKLAIEQGYNANTLVPAIISTGNDRNHEALTFLIVNRTAKGIKADLTDELIYKTIPEKALTDKLKEALSLSITKTIGEFSIDITKAINQNKSSIWFERITMPEQVTSGKRIIKQRSFSLSIIEAIKSCGTLKRASNIGDTDSVVKWLSDYWQAIEELCPKATSLKESDNYVLMKTVGVEVMNKLFGRVLDDTGKDPEISDFVKSLSKMESFEDSSWKSETGSFAKKGTNNASIDSIYDILELEFDKASV